MERYGHELKKNLEKIEDEELKVVGFQPEIPKALTVLPALWRYRISRYYYYPYFAQRHEGNVNHIIDHSFAQVARFLNKGKTVVTCHDLIPLKYLPDGTRVEKDSVSLELFQKSVGYLKEVRLVLADSEATKIDLISLLQVPEERIRVVPLGRNEAFKPHTETSEIKSKLNLPSKKLLLHVGHNLPYKNIPSILRAMKILKDKDVSFHFVKVGPEFSVEQAALISELNLSDVITQVGHLSEKELISLYNSVDLLVYPSLFEGFGLPVLEAMSTSLPVLVSTDTSLEEITAKIIPGVDPKVPEVIAQGIIEILNLKSQELGLLKEKLFVQANKFSWEKTAQLTYQAYRDIHED
jgi:glycosyltransferase involved in cell wall biosynthesis